MAFSRSQVANHKVAMVNMLTEAADQSEANTERVRNDCDRALQELTELVNAPAFAAPSHGHAHSHSPLLSVPMHKAAGANLTLAGSHSHSHSNHAHALTPGRSSSLPSALPAESKRTPRRPTVSAAGGAGAGDMYAKPSELPLKPEAAAATALTPSKLALYEQLRISSLDDPLRSPAAPVA